MQIYMFHKWKKFDWCINKYEIPHSNPTIYSIQCNNTLPVIHNIPEEAGIKYGIIICVAAWAAATAHKHRWLQRRTSAAERSYPTSKVRGRSQEDPTPEGWWPRGATPRPRSGAAAERSYPPPEFRGGSRECQTATVKEQPRGATPRRRSGAAAGRSYPTPEEWWLHGHRRA